MITIIDDDEATRSALAGLMRAKGYGVAVYDSAEAFLREWTEDGSQCIITDIQMPGMSGIELKGRLQARHCKAPVIMITARAEPQLHIQAMQSGAFELLHKPFKATELLDSVARALRA